MDYKYVIIDGRKVSTLALTNVLATMNADDVTKHINHVRPITANYAANAFLIARNSQMAVEILRKKTGLTQARAEVVIGAIADYIKERV